MSGFRKVTKTPRRYRAMTRLARWMTKVFSIRKGGDITKLPPPLNAWTTSRVFPNFAAKSFTQRWRERMISRKQADSA
jgi:L-lactate dehydrogenase complex protein LldF